MSEDNAIGVINFVFMNYDGDLQLTKRKISGVLNFTPTGLTTLKFSIDARMQTQIPQLKVFIHLFYVLRLLKENCKILKKISY